jgi:hypothetical protein
MNIVTGHIASSVHRFLTGLIFLGMAFYAGAQDRESARVYHLEGRDFSLVLNNEQTVFHGDALIGGGIDLEPSGTVHTDAGTFLEIQLIPSGTVIKLADNTSFVYNGFDEQGRFVELGLIYGRIRVVTNGRNTVVIRSGGVSVRIEDGDLGVDYFLEPGGQSSVQRPLYRFYAFRGGMDVFPYGYGASSGYSSGGYASGGSGAYFSGAQTLTAKKGESLTLEISSSHTFAEKQSLGSDILAYWRRNNFAGSPPLSMPNTAIAEAAPETPAAVTPVAAPPPAEPIIIYEPVKPNNRVKNWCLSIGLFLTASSVAFQGVSHYDISQFASDYYNWSYIPLGLGLITTLVGILINPSTPAK